MLTSFDLQQHITFPTHDKGHLLDLLITRSSSNIVSSICPCETYLSDHIALSAMVSFPHKNPSSYQTVTFRPWSKLDMTEFKRAIFCSTLYTNPAETASEVASQFNSVLLDILDKFIPCKSKKVVDRPPQPWFNSEIAEAKRRRSQLERWWKSSRLPSDRQKFREQCKSVRKLISLAKSTYLTNVVMQNSSNPRLLWKSLNALLHREKSTVTPSSTPLSSLPDLFCQFFLNKISAIRLKFQNVSLAGFSLPQCPPSPFHSFKPTTLAEVRQIIFSSPSCQCTLDVLPNRILKECFDVLGPIITGLINLSLSEGCFPSSFAHALVHPLLKKPSLSADDLSNYRPISNLNFLSKVLERIVAKQMHAHLSSNAYYLPFQSAYRKYHSTETTLLAVQDFIIQSMDAGKVTALILLDLSAAFDTVDHSILLHRLQNWFGISDIALRWFTSYLHPRTQSVIINETLSTPIDLLCGVPQGSVLGPLLFTLYTTPLGSLLAEHQVTYHLYADDTQILISFDSSSSDSSLDTLSCAFSNVQSWMESNKLLLNPSKTEFLLLGTSAQLKKFESINSVTLGDSIIQRNSCARNLGVIFDSSLSFTNHVNSVCKSVHYHIRDLYRIRHLLPKPVLIQLANALVSSRLDYCNSLLFGIKKSNLQKLQRVQNSLARVVSKTPKFQHISPVRKALHWLPVEQRIKYKICLLVYKTITYNQPSYLLTKLVTRPKNHSTRYSTGPSFIVPYARTTFGTHCFSVFGPKLWNSLPISLRASCSLSSFRSGFKTYLFDLAYPP